MSEFQGLFGNIIKTVRQSFPASDAGARDTGHKVKFLRPGGIVYCKQPDGKRQYGVLTGLDWIITFTGDRQFEEHSPAEFIAAVGGKKLWVAAQDRIAVGNLRISQKAHLTRADSGQWEDNTAWILACLGGEAATIDEQLEQRFGQFEWKKYRITPA